MVKVYGRKKKEKIKLHMTFFKSGELQPGTWLLGSKHTNWRKFIQISCRRSEELYFLEKAKTMMEFHGRGVAAT